MDLRPLARAERADLAGFLATLSPDQWGAPTLCGNWSVRDVVAHVVGYDELGPRATLAELSAQVRRTLEPAARSGLTDAELVAKVRAHVDPSGLTTAFRCGVALTDGLIHHQDIRRSLGAHRDVPEERLRPALRFALYTPVIHGVLRVRGLRLVTTDMDWTWGRARDPGVQGRAEALLMAIAGRRGVVGELAGVGVPTLAARLGG